MKEVYSTRNFGAIVAVSALVTFLMCAAASSIISSAKGVELRALRFAADSVVAAGEKERVVSGEAGVKAPKLVEVPPKSINSESSVDADVRGNVVGVGMYAGGFDDLRQVLRAGSNDWLAVEPEAGKRVRNAAIAIGARLRRRGLTAFVLPRGFAGADGEACNVMLGLHLGGVIPILRLPATNVADAAATRSCLKRMARRDPTVYVDARNGLTPRTSTLTAGSRTVFEVSPDGIGRALNVGAMVIAVRGMRREEVIRLLTSRSSAVDSSAVRRAARRFSTWLAFAPTRGAVPARTSPGPMPRRPETVRLRGLGRLDHAESRPPGGSGTQGKPTKGTNPDKAVPGAETGGARPGR